MASDQKASWVTGDISGLEEGMGPSTGHTQAFIPKVTGLVTEKEAF